MNENLYELTIACSFKDKNTDTKDYLDLLYENGFNDATVGVGTIGEIGIAVIMDIPDWNNFDFVQNKVNALFKILPHLCLRRITITKI